MGTGRHTRSDKQPPGAKLKTTGRLAPVAAAIAALSTLACCLPLGIAGAAGALGLSLVLDSLRPWLISFAVIFLAVGLFQIYRGRRSCRRPSPASLVLFAVCAGIVLAVVAFPQRVAEVMAALP